MVVQVKASVLVANFRNDPEIKTIIDESRKITTGYDTYKAELSGFTVGATKRLASPSDFEAAVERLRMVGSYLDRMVEIRSILLKSQRRLKRLQRAGSVLLGEFHHVKTIRTVTQRDSWIDEVMAPISDKLAQLAELLDMIENQTWNLKTTYSLISTQIDISKTVYYMRNPEFLLKGNTR